jgi:hypothetical protein
MDASWRHADEGHVHELLIPYVEQVERAQSDLFDRFLKLSSLYDPYAPCSSFRDNGPRDISGLMQENLIASNCDAITGSIAATDVRARFQSDGADWSQQRTLKNLTWYGEGLSAKLDLDEHCRRAFHAGSLKGTGLVKGWNDEWGEIRSEEVPVDDIVVDDAAYRGTNPREMAQRMLIGRDVLAAQFPEHERAIDRAQTNNSRAWKRWAGYRPIPRDQIVCIETWRLPLGPKGHEKYVPGRHAIVIDGADLYDDREFDGGFPFAVFRWVLRPGSWYGIGGGERIIGHQRKLNKRNLQIDRQHDQHAFPTQFVRPVDASLAVKTTGRAGNVVVVKGEYPKTVTPTAIAAETFKDRDDTKGSAFEEFGQSRMQATAMKPAGLDSGAALREYRDQTTSRFATQEKGFERLKLDVVLLAIECAKRLGSKAPEIVRQTKFGSRKIPWAKVDMGDVRVQISVASALGRTPAGRTQFVLEMAQAGIISQESARRLLMPNSPLDVEAEMSRYVAALEDIERTIDEIEDGAVLMPEPYQNLEMGIWRMQAAYLKDRDDGAPESVLEALRQWIVVADYQLGLAAMANQPDAANANAEPALPGAAPMPMEQAPQAALSPQAMQLRAV